MNLPENIFVLHSDLPDQASSDPQGNVLYYSHKHGWMVAGYDEADEMITDFGCTLWTFTPPLSA